MFRILAITLAAGIAAAQDLDSLLSVALTKAGFTGTVGSSIQTRLGRPIDPKLADPGAAAFLRQDPRAAR
jgi:hypothetical protein